ncbi:MAG: hypothetical protein ACREEM_49300 [Blastocatellia bacterium]
MINDTAEKNEVGREGRAVFDCTRRQFLRFGMAGAAVSGLPAEARSWLGPIRISG